MRRILIATVLILGILQLPVTAFASEKKKEIQIEFSSIPDEINLGESFTIVAYTPKHGSSYADEWVNAVKTETHFNEETGMYQSTAEFNPDKAGVYEISYSINMKPGKSSVSFTGSVKKTVTVIDARSVTGAAVRNIVQTPVMKGDAITGYSLCGQVYALWSDGTETDLEQVVFVFIKPDEDHKEITVSFTLENRPYEFKATISLAD